MDFLLFLGYRQGQQYDRKSIHRFTRSDSSEFVCTVCMSASVRRLAKGPRKRCFLPQGDRNGLSSDLGTCTNGQTQITYRGLWIFF